MGLTIGDLEMGCVICRWLMNDDQYVDHYFIVNYSDIWHLCTSGYHISPIESSEISHWLTAGWQLS